MKTTKLKWERDMDGVWLCALVSEQEALTALENFEQGKEHTVEVKKARKRRSLDANAYFWELVGKLAAFHKIPASDIYRSYIREIGDNFKTLCMLDGAVDTFKRIWERNGLGWQVETFPSKLEGCTNVRAYVGSSEYDSRQMSRLIDMAVQDCEDAGIETATPDEIARYKNDWQ